MQVTSYIGIVGRFMSRRKALPTKGEDQGSYSPYS